MSGVGSLLARLGDWGPLTRRRARSQEPAASLTPANARVLVCGASGGLGQAIAERFARDGAKVALHFNRSRSAAERLAAGLVAEGCAAPALVGADLRDVEAAGRCLGEAAAALGGLDVLVLAVGSAKDGPLALVDDDDMAKCMRDNLAPVVNAAEAFRALRGEAGGGAIVVVSSVTGLVGQPMRVAYGAAKAAVISYCKSLAREVADSGLRVNIVAPQVTEGGLADLMKAKVRSVLLANTPLARNCTPQDVAGAVRFLALGDAAFVTGAVVNVSGGLITW